MSEILTRGHPLLARKCAQVRWPDVTLVTNIQRLHRELGEFRRRFGFGRAIAAPQLGIDKRLIAINLGAGELAVLNPQIYWRSDVMIDVWDDCLSVPDYVVRVRRHRSVSLRYQDEAGRWHNWRNLPPDLSELIQHEIDHLDGILMTDRAIDEHAVRPISEHAALIDAARKKYPWSLGKPLATFVR